MKDTILRKYVNGKGKLNPHTSKMLGAAERAYLSGLYPDVGSDAERIYLLSKGDSSAPVCPVCGKRVRFVSFSNGYETYCSVSCARRSVPESPDEKNGDIDVLLDDIAPGGQSTRTV